MEGDRRPAERDRHARRRRRRRRAGRCLRARRPTRVRPDGRAAVRRGPCEHPRARTIDRRHRHVVLARAGDGCDLRTIGRGHPRRLAGARRSRSRPGDPRRRAGRLARRTGRAGGRRRHRRVGRGGDRRRAAARRLVPGPRGDDPQRRPRRDRLLAPRGRHAAPSRRGARRRRPQASIPRRPPSGRDRR